MSVINVELDEQTDEWLKGLKNSKKIKTKSELVRQCLVRMRPIIDSELGYLTPT
jgi:Arc/MetJ-type ribon-helix-helix transcriptional regulator